MLILHMTVLVRLAGTATGHCYDGIAYKTEACAACAGPGPSQCTACAPGTALVPWRNHDTIAEGTCQLYKSDIQVQQLPGFHLVTVVGHA